ncbi:MAG TPA: 23S rRNA (adenine(2030)-N(6))-methyltransferase RlmJ [Roseiarcus sp.]|nr:23S rRNA (adenine(2030)-N(6))-methyltransferase RlmJ [Roseiarcus sp.]
MNYRHAYHAGNFADVFKHVFLARILSYLTLKETALRFMDTHAGIGRYDLTAEEAQRSGEWRDGVARLKAVAPPAPVAALLEPYLRALGPLDEAGRPKLYPGSPAIAQALLRPQDRIALAELHPEDRAALVANMGRDGRLAIVELDGYMALNAWTPPKEKRGLALIDPPFEAADEMKRIVDSRARAIRKWPRGIYALWRPIKDRQDDGRFLNALAALGAPNMLRLELDVGAARSTSAASAPLTKTGLILVNPPHVLFDEAQILLPYLGKLLARSERAGFLCEWLTASR